MRPNATGGGVGTNGYKVRGRSLAKARSPVPAHSLDRLRTAALAQVGAMDELPEDLTELMASFPNLDTWVSQSEGRIVLSKIVVPGGQRGNGQGTRFLETLCAMADRDGLRIEASPSVDFGGNVRRLRKFYGRFGFVENKGRHRDFEVSESMYRAPQ